MEEVWKDAGIECGGGGLPRGVEEILRGQPLNPYARLEMRVMARQSGTMVDPDRGCDQDRGYEGQV